MLGESPKWQSDKKKRTTVILCISTLSLFLGPQIHFSWIVKPIIRTFSASMTVQAAEYGTQNRCSLAQQAFLPS